VTKKKLLLIDGHSVAFRAFYALHSQLERMKNSNGLHTNALYGFHNMLDNVVQKEQPSHALVAFDAGATTFRNEFFEDYKGGRDSMPSELSEQIPYLKELLQAFGIKHYELPDYEADDIIGTLAKEAEANDFEVVVITGDKDLTQLSTENTRIDYTVKGVSQLEGYTPEKVKELEGVRPDQMADYLGLAGDPSDNIPGVTGVGDKTAIKLLEKYDTMENMYAHIDEMNQSKRKENLINEKETALLSKKLATIDRDAPIEVGVDTLEYNGKDIEKLVRFYKEMDFNSHLEKLDTSEYMEVLSDDEEAHEIEYTFVEEITADMFADRTAFYIEMLDENYLKSAIECIAWGNDEHVYVASEETAFASDVFKDYIQDESKQKIVYDSKAFYVALHLRGLELEGVAFDLMLASYLLTSEDSSSGDVNDLTQKHGYTNILPDEAVYGKGKSKGLPDDVDKMHKHVATKIDGMYALKHSMEEELAENEQEMLLYDIEMPLAIILGDMEIEGIKVDAETITALQTEFAKILTDIEEDVYELAGEAFNLNSPKQLSEILFDKMGYEPIRKTKTGYSTAQDVLEKMEDYAPIVKYILKYRQIAKIQSTYVDGLLKVIDPDTGLVHTRFQQTVARTGRLSSVDPNLQNIPIRTEEGRLVRQAFVPRHEGWKLFSADYSQIELRLFAHISKDENMLRTFQEGGDIHTTAAVEVFGLNDASEVTPNMRRDAKAVNFGIVYGISDYGLSQNLNISRAEAKEYIDRYFERFPGVKEYIDDIIREAKETGYVETIFHRRRYLDDINSRNFNLRSFAERTAMNTPIQGSAADIIKVAMIKVAERLEAEGLEANMLLQVHDELVFEAPAEEIPVLEKLVKETMEGAIDLDIPLTVESSAGDTWFDL
jgi:DNA polymerase-1